MSAPAWLQLLIFVFLIGVLLGAPWLIYFAVAVIVIIWLSFWWRNQALKNVHYSRRFFYRRGFPGEKSEVRITLANEKFLPLSWLRTSDLWPNAVGPEDETVLGLSHLRSSGALANLYSMRWFERHTRIYPLLFRQRGIYQIGPVTLEAGDFFGLYEQRHEYQQTELLTVFPEILPLARLQLPAEDPFGDRKARRPLFEDPNLPMGIRPYHPEDGFRRIHWPATARTGSLQTRVYQPVVARTLVVCLNIATQQLSWLGYNAELLEQLVKIGATLVYHGIEDGYSVGLFANGCLAQADQPFRIQPGKSSGQMAHLLTALAGVTPYVTAPFETFLIHSTAEIPYGATLVIVTALLPESLQDTLIRLRRYRHNILLISLDPAPPPNLPDIQVIHLPLKA